MRRLNASFASCCKELLDTAMPEALDHVYSEARHGPNVKQINPVSVGDGTNSTRPPYNFTWDAQVQLAGSMPGSRFLSGLVLGRDRVGLAAQSNE
jgi:hypothetical protein